jgi:hypothetical protein
MRHSKFGLRAFGLALVAVLGLMAFSAVAAQAANLTGGGEGGLFEILKGKVAVEAGQKVTGELENWTDGLLHGFLLVPNSNLSLLCSGLQVLQGEFKSDTEALAEVKFTGCKAFEFNPPKEELKECIVVSKFVGGEVGVVVASAIVLAKKHEKEGYVQFEPDGGLVFTSILFEKGTACTLPAKNEIKGTLGALVQGIATGSLITANGTIQTLMGDLLKFGANEAIVEGNAKLKLIGKNEGCEFGVV